MNNAGKCFFRATKEAFTSTSAELSSFVDVVEQRINSNTEKLPTYERTRAGSNGTSGLGETNNINHKFQFHYAPTFGAVCGALNISLNLTQRMFLRCMLRDLFSSAARLNIMGPLEGARMQREYSPVVEKLLSTKYDKEIMMLFSEKVHTVNTTPTVYVPQLNAASDIAVDDRMKSLMSTGIDASQPVTTSPILEILQARHDVLYARLFNS
jgi:urease accessory protein UreF